MLNLRKRLQIIGSVLLISSVMCNLPGGSEPSDQAAVSSPETIEIVNEETITEGVDAFAVDLTVHQETAELLTRVQADGYTSFVEGGEFELSNGRKMRAVSISNNEKIVILAQIENQSGSPDAMIFEFINATTMRIWDLDGSIDISVNEAGDVDYSAKDSAGNPVLAESYRVNSHNKLASITPQIVNNCHNGMGDEFMKCMNGLFVTAAKTVLCGAAFKASIAACTIPPFAGCPLAIAVAVASCGSTFGVCIWDMVDDPPTFEYSVPEEVKGESPSAISYCREGNLFIEQLYQVQVVCKDDRVPVPQPIMTVFMFSGEAKESPCIDCSGQKAPGTIPPPGEITSIDCDYGCLIVGDGNDRCLKEGETPQEAPAENTSIPVGTYKGTTDLGKLYVEAWGGSVTTNEIIITVAEDGTTSGSFTSIYDSGWAEPIEWGDPPQNCTSQILITEIGTLNGQLIASSGTLAMEVTLTKYINRSGCPSPTETETLTDSVSVIISITDETMTGNAPDYSMTFEATKQ
jgi:hypothetical protein